MPPQRSKRLLVLATGAGTILLVLVVFSMGRARPRPPLPNPNGYDDFLQAAAFLTGDLNNARCSTPMSFGHWFPQTLNRRPALGLLTPVEYQPDLECMVQRYQRRHPDQWRIPDHRAI
ncbi:MAG TPA: hypothetical protein VNZ64_09050 [Candidatus Acidoferrum sp.]|jgi:hypothetical protein|nr:hypothetical protein [Candidatus Acidoferrum sp.]